MSTSVHDHHVLELTVNATQRYVRLRTAYPERSGPELSEIVLEDVAGYVFHGDALGTILFDIEAVDPIELYREHAIEMQRAYATSGGHRSWAESDSSAAEFFARGELRGYRLSSSIGLEGAVWAQRLVIRDFGTGPRSADSTAGS